MEGGTEATETKLGTCQRGLGSYNRVRAVRPVNVPLLIESGKASERPVVDNGDPVAAQGPVK